MSIRGGNEVMDLQEEDIKLLYNILNSIFKNKTQSVSAMFKNIIQKKIAAVNYKK